MSAGKWIERAVVLNAAAGLQMNLKNGKGIPYEDARGIFERISDEELR